MQLRVDHVAAESGLLFLLDRLIDQNRIGSHEAGASGNIACVTKLRVFLNLNLRISLYLNLFF